MIRSRATAVAAIALWSVIASSAAALPAAAAGAPIALAKSSSPESDLSTTADDSQAVMIDVNPADYRDAAAELPAPLTQALARDVDLTGAEWLAQSDAANAAADVVAQLSEQIEVVDASLEGYELVVTVETAKDARLVESVGGIALIGEATERGIDTTTELLPAADLRGGTPYIFPSGSGQARCSVGFVGTNTATGQTQVMSAGHCQGNASSLRQAATSSSPTVSGGTVGSPYTSIGNASLHVTGAYSNPGYTASTFYDLGMTPVTTSGWVGKPEVVTWGGSTTGAPLASAPLVVRDAGPAIVGSTVCKSGATTGWTCGAVTDVDAINLVGSGSCSRPTSGSYCVGGIEADICVRAGDSGGSALVGSRAVGITSASSTVSGGCGSGGIGVFSTLYSADPALERVTKVWPYWEPLVGVETPAVNEVDRVFSGTLDNASPRHRIEIVFSTGETLVTGVASDGSWQLDTQNTNPAKKSYVITARWGFGSSSTTVEGFLDGPDPLSEPTSLTAATNTAAALALNWGDVVSDGGSAVTDYVVEYKRSTSSAWTSVADGVSTGKSYTFVNPSPGVTFEFRVQAKNAFGVGPYSSVLTVTTPTLTPTVVGSLTAPVNNGASLQLTWDAPVWPGASAVTDYVVQFKRSTSTTWSTVADGVSTVRSYTFVSPTAGVTFNFRVQAKNAYGVGPVSSVLTVTTPTATPSAVVALAAPVNNGASLQLTWDAPASAGAGAVTDYVVQFKRSTSSTWSTVADGVSTLQSYTFVNPTAGVTFNFRVQAKNAYGVGPVSSVLTVTTPTATPSAVVALAAPVNNGASLQLTWDAPASSGAGAVTDYVVQFKRSTSTTWSAVADGVSTLQSYTFVNPTAGVTFNFRVQAKNAYGVGPYSSVLTVTTPL